MLHLVTYLLQMDRETWGRFKARLKEDGLKVGDGIRTLIDLYIDNGLPKKSQTKDKK